MGEESSNKNNSIALFYIALGEEDLVRGCCTQLRRGDAPMPGEFLLLLLTRRRQRVFTKIAATHGSTELSTLSNNISGLISPLLKISVSKVYIFPVEPLYAAEI